MVKIKRTEEAEIQRLVYGVRASRAEDERINDLSE